jgi:hypothetical protein
MTAFSYPIEITITLDRKKYLDDKASLSTKSNYFR